MARRMERTAEIIDTASGNCRKTGQGAVFVGATECQRELAKLRRLEAGDGARFVVDWWDDAGNLVESFSLDEAGFEALIGFPPKTPEEYVAYDEAFWAGMRAAHGAFDPIESAVVSDPLADESDRAYCRQD